MANTKPTKFYYGKRADIVRELGGMTHIYSGAYLIQPDGNAAFDAEGCDDEQAMLGLIDEYKSVYPDAEFINL